MAQGKVEQTIYHQSLAYYRETFLSEEFRAAMYDGFKQYNFLIYSCRPRFQDTSTCNYIRVLPVEQNLQTKQVSALIVHVFKSMPIKTKKKKKGLCKRPITLATPS